MNEPPDQTAVLSAANLLSAVGITVPKYFAHDLRVLAQGGVHVEEDHPQLGQILADRVVDHLRFVLRGDAAEELRSASGMPSRSKVFLMFSGTSSQSSRCFSIGRM